MKYFVFFAILIFDCAMKPIEAQVLSFPYTESFDGTIAPVLPAGWSITGFKDTISSPHSAPNCIYGVGNATLKTLTSPLFNFTDRIPETLTFWERRSGTAAAYHLEVRASLDGTNFNILLARFDTITSTSNYVQRIVNLKGSGLQQQSSVRFRWQLLNDSTNNTGVLRIDDISLRVATGFDLGLTRMAVSPANATRKDTLAISVCVKNYGMITASNFSVKFFSDDNHNDIAESSEQIFLAGGLILNPMDSLACEVPHPPMKPGEYRFIAVIEFSQDENTTNDSIHVVVNVQNVKGDLLINEIMYAPVGDEPEWIELYNISPDSINLRNWRISDSNVSTKNILSQSDKIIASGSFLVIAKDTNFAMIHQDVLCVVSNFSALNNTTPDAVVLYDPSFHSIDSVMYQPNWGGQNGKSLERIDVYSSSISDGNWETSQDSKGCTPGKINSIAKLDYDISLSSLTQTRVVSEGKMISVLNVTIQNIGRQAIDSIIVHFYAVYSHSLSSDTIELLQSIISTQKIYTGDSIQITEQLPQLAAGEADVMVIVANWKDERIRNNRDSITIRTGYEPCSLIINEIMYDPLDGQNEWFELYNRSSLPIDLVHWTFNDGATLSRANSFLISNRSLIVRPREFAIIAADSTFLSLFSNSTQSDSTFHSIVLNQSGGFSFNNDGDAIVVKDLTGQIIDSVFYVSRWHHPDIVDTHGRSLERINPNLGTNDPRNWSTCTHISGGTPGKINSIMTTSLVNKSIISISPNPFSPDGDGYEDFCTIHYNLPMMVSTIDVRIYDIKGRLIRTLANGELAGTQSEIIWNGFDDNGQRARIGVYVILLEATDRSSGRTEKAKAVAVVAAKF